MQRGRILVVDDLPDVRMTVSGLLEDCGHEVWVAANPREALELLNIKRFKVAILDIRLDETDEDNQDGFILMHKIKKNYPAIAIIILTGYADVKMVREALQPDSDGVSPAFGFLEKTEMSDLPSYAQRAFDHVSSKSKK